MRARAHASRHARCVRPPAPEEIPGSDFTLEADLVIKALGFDPEDLPTLFDAPDLGVTRWGTLHVDRKT